MADQNYEQWLKDREVELAGTRQLTGVDRATPEQPKISRLRQAAAITPLIKPAGGVYTLPDSEVSKYDEELPLGSDITDLNVLLQNRADSQSILSKVLNSTVGGVASGILTAGETVGYIMDIPHYISKLLGAEGQEDNMVSKAFRDMKKDLYTNVPVYEDVETSGALDSFFRWSTVRGIIDSAVGFGIPGGMVSKAVNWGVKGLRLTRSAAWLRTNGIITEGVANKVYKAASSQIGKNILRQAVGGYITNGAEGRMMAIELGETLKNDYITNKTRDILEKEYNGDQSFAEEAYAKAQNMYENDLDFHKEVGRQQDNFVANNRLMMITDMVQLAGLSRSFKSTRQILKARKGLSPLEYVKKSFTTVGGLGLQGVAEGVEEVYQNMIQLEAGYQARKNTNIRTEADKALDAKTDSDLDRYLAFATSNQAIVEGLMGLVSGGLQRQFMVTLGDSLSGDFFGKKRKEEYDTAYNNQQEEIKKYTVDNLNKIILQDQATSASAKETTDDYYRAVSDTAFNQLALKAVVTGTTERLEDNLTDIIEMSPEKAKEAGLDDNYREIFGNRLSELAEIENLYLRHSEDTLGDLLTQNRVQKMSLDKLLKASQHSVDWNLNELNNEIKSRSIELFDEQDNPISTLSLNNIKNLTEASLSKIVEIPAYIEIYKQWNRLNTINEVRSNLDKEYLYYKLPETIDEIKRRRKEGEAATQKATQDNINKEESKLTEELSIDLTEVKTIEEVDAIIAKFKITNTGAPEDLINKVTTKARERFITNQNRPVRIASELSLEETSEFHKIILDTAKEVFPNAGEDYTSGFDDFFGLAFESDEYGNITRDSKPVTYDDLYSFLDNAVKDKLNNQLVKKYFTTIKDKLLNQQYKKEASTKRERATGVEDNIKGVAISETQIASEDGIVIQESDSDPRIIAHQETIIGDIIQTELVSQGLTQGEIDLLNSKQNSPERETLDRPAKGLYRAIAYLTRPYRVIMDKKIGKSRIVDASNEVEDAELLRNQMNLKVGSTITFRIADTDSQVINDPFSQTNEKVTWGDFKQTLKGSSKSQKEKDLLLSTHIPIQILFKDKVIGYIPTYSHLQRSGDVNRADSISKLVELRGYVLSEIETGRTITSTITSISNGYFIYNISQDEDGNPIESAIPTMNAFPSKEVTMAYVDKNGTLVGANVPTKVINRKTLKKGYTYAVVPNPQGYIAIPILNNKLSNNQQYSVLKAIDIFIKSYTQQHLTPSEVEIVEKINTTLGTIQYLSSSKEKISLNVDITTPTGLRNYISAFTYITIPQGHNLTETIKDKPSNYKAISIDFGPVKNNKDVAEFIKIEFSSGMQIGSTIFKINKRVNQTTGEIKYETTYKEGANAKEQSTFIPTKIFEHLNAFKDRLTTHLSQTYFSANGQLLKNKDDISIPEIVKTDSGVETVFTSVMPYTNYVKQNTQTNLRSLNIGTIEQPVYIYTQQRKYSFDSNIVEDATTKLKSTKKATKGKKQVTDVNPTPTSTIIKNTKVTILNEEGISDELNELYSESAGLNSLDDLTDTALNDLLTNEVGISLFSENINNIGLKLQKREIDTIITLLQTALLKSDSGALSISDVDEVFKDRKEVLNKLLQNSIKEDKQRATALLGEIVDDTNWDRLKTIVFDRFASVVGISVKKSKTALDLKDESMLGDSGTTEQTRYIESYSLQLDPRLSMSSKLKLAMWSIPSGEKGIGKIDIPIPFDEIYSRLTGLTSGLPANYDVMMNTLKEYAEKGIHEWLPDFIDIFENLVKQDPQLKKQFVTAMTKHHVNMMFLAWKRLQSNEYKMRMWRANSNSIEMSIKNAWFKNLIQGYLIVTDSEGNYIFSEAAKELAKIMKGESFDNIDTTSIEEVKMDIERKSEVINRVLSPFGIILSKNTITDIIQTGLFYKGSIWSYEALFGANGAVIQSLYKEKINAARSGEDELQDLTGSEIFSSTVINAIIEKEAHYTNLYYESMFKSGDKSIWAYTNNRFLANRVRDLNTDRALLTKLSKSPLTKHTSLLRQMLTLTDDGEFLYDENGLVVPSYTTGEGMRLELDYVGLNALKEMYAEYTTNKGLNEISPVEHEAYKIAAFFNNNSVNKDKTSRVGKLFYLSMSDKDVMTMLNTYLSNFSFDEDGDITNDGANILFKRVVLPEIERMKAHRTLTDFGKIPHATYKDEAAQIFYSFHELNDIESLFTVVNGKRFLDETFSESQLQQIILPTIKNKITMLIDEQINNWAKIGFGLNTEKNQFNLIDADQLAFYKGKISQHSNESLADYNDRLNRLIALDYIANYMVFNSSLFYLFSGDPALAFKKDDTIKDMEKNNQLVPYSTLVESTMTNYNKRLAADSAPGWQADFSDIGSSYKIAVANDVIGTSIIKDYINKMISTKKFENIVRSDGAELITVAEHLKILYAYGKGERLDFIKYKTLLDKYRKQVETGNPIYDYDAEELELLNTIDFTMLKPVQVMNRWDNSSSKDELNTESKIYIKSASLTLLPQFTRGWELDKVRVAMEQQGVDRLVFQSSFKNGIPNNVLAETLIADDSSTIFKNSSDLKFSTIELDRSGFFIQQEVPVHEEEDTINISSQIRELLFSGLRHIDKFSKLEKTYLKVYEELFNIHHKEFLDEFDYDSKTGKLNLVKLFNLITKEAKNRLYSTNNLVGLQLDKNGKIQFPLWGLPASSAVEALLLSLVDNRIRKWELPGASSTLAPDIGLTRQTIDANSDEGKKLLSDSKYGIITTNNWDGTSDLLPQRIDEKTGKTLPAQILISNTLRDVNGNLVNLSTFTTEVDGRLMLDPTKVPVEFLRGFAFRIPTSSHASMMSFEIVGFLPPTMKNTVIAPKDTIDQMGSDFDIDKLFSYLTKTVYNPVQDKFMLFEDIPIVDVENFLREKANSTAITAKGKDFAYMELVRKFNLDQDVSRLQNKLLQIHREVIEDPNVDVVRLQGINTDRLEALAKYVKASNFYKQAIWDITTPNYQMSQYLDGVAGKQGVGVFSALIVFMASAEAAEISYVEPIRDGDITKNGFKLTINNKTTTGDLSSSVLLDKKVTDVTARRKVEVASQFQNASVDNGKLKALTPLNINSTTFNAITAAIQFGYNEDDIISIIAQPIIRQVVTEYEKANSGFVEGTSKNLSSVIKNMRDIVAEQLLVLRDADPNDDAARKTILGETFTYSKWQSDSLLNLLNKPFKKGSYDELAFNYYLLSTFYKLTKAGQRILTVQNTVNFSSKGIGKSFIESAVKEEKVKTLLTNTYIPDAVSLLGKYNEDTNEIVPTTVRGFIYKYVLQTANSIYKDDNGNPLYPYRTALPIIMDILAINKRTYEGAAEEAKIQKIFNLLKSFTYTKPNLFGKASRLERERLTIDKKFKNVDEIPDTAYFLAGKQLSLATIIDFIQKSNSALAQDSFIKILDPTINSNGEPSTVTFNASKSSGIDESVIYNAFTYLLLSKEVISLEKDGQTLEIPVSKLAQDLIRLAYLEGGVQEAIQYIRYIPTQVLISTEIGKQLLAETFEDETLREQFKIQYYQHYPWEIKNQLVGDAKVKIVAGTDPYAPIVDNENGIIITETDYKDGVKDSKLDYMSYITAFKLSDDPKYMSKIIRLIGEDQLLEDESFIMPQLISVKLKYRKYSIFKFDPIQNTYYRIDTLGYNKGKSHEFQADINSNQVAKSVANSNHSGRQMVKYNATRKNPNSSIRTIGELNSKNIVNTFFTPSHSTSVLTSWAAIVNNLGPHGPQEFRNEKLHKYGIALTTALSNYGINPTVSVVDRIEDTSGIRGKFYKPNLAYPSGQILIRQTPSLDINYAKYYTTVLLHESSHALLYKVIDDFNSGKKLPLNINSRLKALDLIREALLKKSKNNSSLSVEVTQGLSSLHEFIAAVSSSEEFRNYLQNNTFSKYDRIIKLLAEIFSILLPETMSGNEILDFVDTIVLDVISSKDVIETIKTTSTSKKSTSASFFKDSATPNLSRIETIRKNSTVNTVSADVMAFLNSSPTSKKAKDVLVMINGELTDAISFLSDEEVAQRLYDKQYLEDEVHKREQDEFIQSNAINENLIAQIQKPTTTIESDDYLNSLDSFGLMEVKQLDIEFTDENGQLCAANGLRTNKGTKGSKWEIVKDLGNPQFKSGGKWKLYE